MTLTDHHLLCLGLLASLVRNAEDWDHRDLRAIRETIKSAKKLGLCPNCQPKPKAK